MKKLLTMPLLLIAMMFTGCSANQRNEPSDNSYISENSDNSDTSSDNSSGISMADNSSNSNLSDLESAPSNPDNSDGSKILIAYFSRWGNTEYPDDVDATTAASIVIDGDRFGTTEYVARMIQQNIGGDIHLIETAKPYTADFNELRDVNHNEMANNILPELKTTDLDISKYDTVYVGYPVWATDVPQAVISFLNQYDFSDKTVIPFCTHDGYGAGNSYQTIATASKAKSSLDGIAIEAKDVPKAQVTVTEWLDSISALKAGTDNTSDETAIKIAIGENVLDGVLYDTALAREIKEQFPLTISMSGFGGREYYGGVDFYPENLEGGQKSFENGDITYCEAHHNMAIFYAQTDNPTLSVDVIPVGKVTSDLSVFDTLGSRETVTFSIAE